MYTVYFKYPTDKTNTWWTGLTFDVEGPDKAAEIAMVCKSNKSKWLWGYGLSHRYTSSSTSEVTEI